MSARPLILANVPDGLCILCRGIICGQGENRCVCKTITLAPAPTPSIAGLLTLHDGHGHFAHIDTARDFDHAPTTEEVVALLVERLCK